MECIQGGRSAIQEFYNGTNVLITGGTGFMGKVIMEKLLRSCSGINNIYLLVRSKKGKNVDTRIKELFDDPVFGPLKKNFPTFHHKVTAVTGDCSEPGLGLKPSDRHLLADEINIVFHCAATVNLEVKIRLAVSTNVMGTKNILDLAREMVNLKALIHVSTAYCNCIFDEIKEKFYNYPITHKKLKSIVDAASDGELNKITPNLLYQWPNTYVYTKAMAEDLVRDEGGGLPIGLFRPAIVVATRNEPISGWIDNVYGPSGIVVAVGVGLLRTMHSLPDKIANIVPVDMAVNALIASAWEVGNRTRPQNGDDIPIYNYVSSVQKPITWNDFTEKAIRFGGEVPFMKAIWCCSLTLNKYRFMHLLYVLFLHFLPAFLVDGFSILLGKKPKLVKLYKKVNKFCDIISHFCTRDWKFTNDNVQLLWKKMEKRDRNLFNFDMNELNWEEYFYSYVRGVRFYLVKDDLSTIPQAKLKHKRFYWIQQIMKYIMILLATSSLWSIGTMLYRNFELL